MGKELGTDLVHILSVTIIVMLLSFLVLPSITDASTFTRWEKQYVNYVDGEYKGEIYVEYPSHIYYDPENLDASTKFPIKFYVAMKSYVIKKSLLKNLRYVPDSVKATIYVKDITSEVDEERTFQIMYHYPMHDGHKGLQISYSFGPNCTVKVKIDFPSTSFDWSYEYQKSEWNSLGWLFFDYHQNGFWKNAYIEGCILISVSYTHLTLPTTERV